MILPLGAIIKNTNKYVYPSIANKNDKFECPDCHRELILRKGNKRIHHFAHCKTDNPCNYYTKPTETQIHKDAKMLMKTLLDNSVQITISRICKFCNIEEEYEIPERDNNSNIVIEYRFEYNGTKIADVAFIENNEIISIFEICNTHKTNNEKRPEPWFEIDASTLINIASSFENNKIKIPCIRNQLCDNCNETNVCLGDGSCIGVNDNGNYKKNPFYKCEYNCLLLECPRCDFTAPKRNIANAYNNNNCWKCHKDLYTKQCNGDGICLNQGSYKNQYFKDADYDCSYNCLPIKCKTIHCKTIGPKIYMDCKNGYCIGCDMKLCGII